VRHSPFTRNGLVSIEGSPFPRQYRYSSEIITCLMFV